MDLESNDFVSNKIKSLEELAGIIGSRPRDKKVIMCHGTFDVVHPGHVRHLIYAKSKADILIASLTCDNHVTKANLRPYVPEDLRAFNLSAFEMVDYVIIDRNATPIAALKQLQPDFFAKGYEYVAGDIPPKTREEMETLESFGGEMIFTPGDVVYSSSRFIETAPPNISTEKLMMLMHQEQIGFDDLKATMKRFKGIKVHIVGDTIIDTVTRCTMIGGMTKTFISSTQRDNSKLSANNYKESIGSCKRYLILPSVLLVALVRCYCTSARVWMQMPACKASRSWNCR